MERRFLTNLSNCRALSQDGAQVAYNPRRSVRASAAIEAGSKANSGRFAEIGPTLAAARASAMSNRSAAGASRPLSRRLAPRARNGSVAASAAALCEAGQVRAVSERARGAGFDHAQQPPHRAELSGGPFGAQAGGQLGLALQDQAVGQDLQAVGRQGRAGGGDVDDQLRRARRRRAFGGAAGFDDAVVDDPVAGEEGAGLDQVFGRHPQPPAGAGQIGGGTSSTSAMVSTSIQLCGAATTRSARPKPSGRSSMTRCVDVAAALAQQVLAGDAEMQLAGVEAGGDVGRRQQVHLARRAGP